MKKLYLRGVSLNNCKGFTKLYEIVEKNGGFIVSDWQEKIEPTYIYNYNDNEKLELVTYFTSYINFVLDGHLYYVQLNDNPFFPSYYEKKKIDSKGTASKDVYMNELNEIYFGYSTKDEDIEENAHRLFEFLKNAKLSERYHEYERKRVANLYDNGWHWEEIAKPGRRSIYKRVEFEEEGA